MAIDEKTKDRTIQDTLAPLVEGEASASHDVWMKAEIEKTLAKKKAGKMAYHSLDDVMDEFGFNAR